MLYANFEDADAVEQLTYIAQYNQDHSGSRSWSQFIFDVPFLLKRMITDAFRTGNVVLYLRFMLLLVIAVCYVISPFDILSENIWGIFGAVDDIIVVLSSLAYISWGYYRYLRRRADNQLA